MNVSFEHCMYLAPQLDALCPAADILSSELPGATAETSIAVLKKAVQVYNYISYVRGATQLYIYISLHVCNPKHTSVGASTMLLFCFAFYRLQSQGQSQPSLWRPVLEGPSMSTPASLWRLTPGHMQWRCGWRPFCEPSTHHSCVLLYSITFGMLNCCSYDIGYCCMVQNSRCTLWCFRTLKCLYILYTGGIILQLWLAINLFHLCITNRLVIC